MLTTLLHSGVGEVGAVCVRWYGGTKLGTGGLSRAYAGGVNHALDELETEIRVDRTRAEVVVGYPHVDGLQHLLDEGKLIPAVHAIYPLEDVPLALADLGSGAVCGKAVIRIAPSDAA